MDVLSPQDCWTGTDSDTNNDALVLMLTRGDDSVLFATEPEEPAQQALLDAGVDLQADVLKVPHHGAATSLPAFFQAVQAQVAVVSVGPNDYGHPVPATLDAIAATGAAGLAHRPARHRHRDVLRRRTVGHRRAVRRSRVTARPEPASGRVGRSS